MKRSGSLRRSSPPRRKTVLKARGRRAPTLKELDGLLRRIVLARDGYKCRKCGKGKEDGRVLQAAHIYPKGRHPAMRYRLENLLTLCAYPCHHSWWHKHPIEAARWLCSELPVHVQTTIEILAATPGKIDRKLDKLYLESELARYEGRNG